LAPVLSPLVVEHFALEHQSWLWTFGYFLLIILVAGCAYLVWRAPDLPAVKLATPERIDVELVTAPAQSAPSLATAVRAGKRARRGASPSPVMLAPGAAPPAVNQQIWLRGLGLAALLPVYFLLGESATPTTTSEEPTAARRLRWIGLAAAPSSLMLGVTTYLTTDIAAIPLFWVLPLGVYLLTFILVFMRWPVVW